MSTESLEQEITDVIRRHLIESQRAAERAMAAAFGASFPAKKAPKRSRVATPHRDASELLALQERLRNAVVAQPGETMSVLAESLGSTPRALQVPMLKLRRLGRVRSVGVRQQTRYYPEVDGTEPKEESS